VRRVHRVGLAWALALGACDGDGNESASGGDTAMDDDGGDGASSGDPGDGGDDGDAGDGTDAGGDASGDDGGPGGDASLEEVEAACEADCQAQFATECAPANQNELTCELQCASITVQLGDFCLDEYTAWVGCRADGGYDCVMGYPYPRSTCAGEQQAFTACSADLGCKRYCQDAVSAGCGGDSFEGCLDVCLADKAAAAGYCGIYLDSWRLCEAQFGITCADDGPISAPECVYGLGSYADCVADELDDPCAGYCLVADEIACGSDCAADCAARVTDPTCGQSFASLVDCELRHGDFTCSGEVLLGTGICDYETSNYQTCLAGGG
jgi:hypothetical protein